MHKQVNDILSLLPEALADQSVWQEVLNLIKQAAGVPHMLIAERDEYGKLILDDTPWDHYFVSGYDGVNGIQPYLEYYRKFDYWDGFEAGRLATQPVIVSEILGSRLDCNSQFQEWLSLLDINENAFVKLFDTPAGWVGANLHFDKENTNYKMVLNILEAIKKPLATSIKLQETEFIFPSNMDILNRLEHSSFPQIVMRANCAVYELNLLAEELINKEPGLLQANSKIIFNNSSLQKSFHRSVMEAVKTLAPQVVSVPPHITGNYLTLIISPFYRSRSKLIAPETLICISIVTDESHAPLIRPYARAHGFNATQTKILIEVDKGKGPKQIAEDLGLSYCYVREVLSGMYQVLKVEDLPQLMSKLSQIHRTAI